MTVLRPWTARLVVIVLAVAGLVACYVPDDFKAEVRVAANGDYAISYEGILTWVPLYSDIKAGKVPASEIPEKLAYFEDDLRRDSYFKEVKSLGKGRYRVRYERTGHFKESEQISFVRRNALILTLKPAPDGTVSIAANIPKGDRMKMVTDLGLEITGMLRVTTAVQAIKGNADTVGTYGPFTTYDWHIGKNMMASPKIILKLH